MPKPALQYLTQEVVAAVISVVDDAFSAEGFANVDNRVWTADVPDYAGDPWALVNDTDVSHSQSFEDKDSPVETHFLNISIFATQAGTDTPYADVEAVAQHVVQNMTDGFTVSGRTVHQTRINEAEPINMTGPEQTDLFGRSLLIELHLE